MGSLDEIKADKLVYQVYWDNILNDPLGTYPFHKIGIFDSIRECEMMCKEFISDIPFSGKNLEYTFQIQVFPKIDKHVDFEKYIPKFHRRLVLKHPDFEKRVLHQFKKNTSLESAIANVRKNPMKCYSFQIKEMNYELDIGLRVYQDGKQIGKLIWKIGGPETWTEEDDIIDPIIFQIVF